MASTHRSVLSRSGLPPLRTLLRRWRPRQGAGLGHAHEPAPDPLLAVGRQLRQRREERGLSLRELALRTRISTAVLEALERGWRDRLPEAAYLRTMLPLIEAELELPGASLAPVLPASPSRAASRRANRFTPGSLDVFSSWQGTVLYGLLTLGLIYALNLEQQRLAAQGLLALRPVPAQPARAQPPQASADQALLRGFPELRPLDLAARGQGLKRLQQDTAASAPSTGLLELELQEPRALTLESASGARTSLRNASGSLSLPLSGGFRLQVQPPPGPADRVSWNGVPLQPRQDQPGQFVQP